MAAYLLFAQFFKQTSKQEPDPFTDSTPFLAEKPHHIQPSTLRDRYEITPWSSALYATPTPSWNTAFRSNKKNTPSF